MIPLSDMAVPCSSVVHRAPRAPHWEMAASRVCRRYPVFPWVLRDYESDELDLRDARAYRDRVQQVNEYMRSKALPAALRDKVKDFYLVQYSEGKMFDEAQILSELTPSLREEVKAFEARDLLHKVPLLMASPKEIGAKICAHVRICITFPDECLIHEGHHGESLYFIHSGLVEIKSRYSQRLYHTIGDGCYFGDVAALLREDEGQGDGFQRRNSKTGDPHGLNLTRPIFRARSCTAVIGHRLQSVHYTT